MDHQDALAAFMAARKDTTIRSYRQDMTEREAVETLFASGPGNANLMALNYRAYLQTKGLQPTTVNRRLATLRSLTKFARLAGWISWKIEVQGLRVEAYRDTSGPGTGAYRQMLAQTESRNTVKVIRDKAILRLLHDLGLRRGELCALDMADVDIEKGTVDVLGKGRLQKQRLTLPIPTRDALSAWLDVCGRKDGPLFTNCDRAKQGSGRLTSTGVYKIVRDLGRKVGVETGIRQGGEMSQTVTPPNFPEGERAILAACLIKNACVPLVISELRSRDFYSSAHRAIFEAVNYLSQEGEPIDWVTLPERLKAAGKLEEVGGTEALTILADAVPTTANLSHYIDKVKEYSKLRSILRAANEVVASIHSRSFDSWSMGASLQKIMEGDSDDRKNKVVSLEELFQSDFQYVGQKKNVGVFCGLHDLDNILGGFRPGELIVVAGRPSMGKSALLFDIMLGMCKKKPGVIFSLEDSNRNSMFRLLAKRARVDLRNLRCGAISDGEWSNITQAAGDLADYALYFDESSALSPIQVEMKCRSLEVRLRERLSVISVDHLHLMNADGKYPSETERINSITKSLKQLAKKLNCIVILLCQLNRDLERREFKGHQRMPRLSDLRASGGIEQDADVVVGVYRPEVYPEGKGIEEYRNLAMLPVLKQRNGPPGLVRLNWDPSTVTFRNSALSSELQM